MVSWILSILSSLVVLYFCSSWYINEKEQLDCYNFIVLLFLFLLSFKYGFNRVLIPPPRIEDRPLLHTKERMANIEFLRIIFTIGVLCSHFFKELQLWNNGGWGVTFFFILSGFLLAKNFSPQKETSMVVKNMIIRFVPLIVLGSLLRCLFVSSVDLSGFFSEVFLLSSIGMLKVPQYNGVSWYISVLFWVSLMYFYILKTRKKETINFFLGVAAFIGLIALNKRGLTWDRVLGDPGDIGYLFEMRLIYGVTMVAIGYFVNSVYELLKNKVSTSLGSKITISLLELFLLCYSVSFVFFEDCAQPRVVYITLTFCALIILFALRIGYVSQILERKFWLRLSNYCLAVYLVQGFIVWNLVRFFLVGHSEWMLEHKSLVILITLSACCLAGIWAHHVIEKPCAKFLKKLMS